MWMWGMIDWLVCFETYSHEYPHDPWREGALVVYGLPFVDSIQTIYRFVCWKTVLVSNSTFSIHMYAIAFCARARASLQYRCNHIQAATTLEQLYLPLCHGGSAPTEAEANAASVSTVALTHRALRSAPERFQPFAAAHAVCKK